MCCVVSFAGPWQRARSDVPLMVLHSDEVQAYVCVSSLYGRHVIVIFLVDLRTCVTVFFVKWRSSNTVIHNDVVHVVFSVC